MDRSRSRNIIHHGHREQVPLAVDALQSLHPTVLEPESGSTDELARRLGGQDLTRIPERHHTSPDDDGQPSELAPHLLAFAQMHTRPYLDA